QPRDVEGQGKAEGDRHGVLAVGAAHLQRGGVGAGLGNELAHQAGEVGQQNSVRHLLEAKGTRRVDDIGRGGEQVDEGAGVGTDAAADAVDQGADVVLDAVLFLVDLFGRDSGASPGDVGGGGRRAGAQVGQRGGQGGLDPGEVADLGALGDVWVQPL